ncbi:bidirectional sugar transporter NEC1-like [Bidens hawaiensis]|uniref:bidirectional sugar transporter NEC1-like n=1 Tax=Bidens hawaiensis TaxID=980011 RepID=UPI00404A93C5
MFICWSNHHPQPLLPIYKGANVTSLMHNCIITKELSKMAGNLAHLTLAFGLLGNIISFMVFLAPIPTFYKVYKKKSTEGFQSAAYVVGLFSAMLWIYYACLNTNIVLLITINSVGCFIETAYICFFLFYAPKKARMESLKLIVLLIVVGFGMIILLTQFLASGDARGVIVGWICLVFSLCVFDIAFSIFVAPLGVVRQVVKTKGVEYMPILLSVALTVSAVMWFFYGLLLHDFNIAIPNVLGFIFGIIQMILYFLYKNKKPFIDEKITNFEKKNEEMKEQEIPGLKDQNIIDVVAESLQVVVEHPHSIDHVAVEPQALPDMPTRIIQVSA